MRRVCRQCRRFVDDGKGVCTVCQSSDFTTTWQGRLSVIEPAKSFIAKKVGAVEGDYALRIR